VKHAPKDREEAAAAAGRKALEDGENLDAVLAIIEEASLPATRCVKALHSVIGGRLIEVVDIRESFRGGGGFAHIGKPQVELMRSVPFLGGDCGHRIRRYFIDAVLWNAPWLTLTPGAGERAGSVIERAGDAPTRPEDPAQESLTGTNVEFDRLRAALKDTVTVDPFFRDHVVIRETARSITCRFILE
jgi:hypothetical protein